MTYIYSLSDPITNEIRYVGKTRNPEERFKNHCNPLHNRKSHKRNWVNKLRRKGVKPVFEILDIVDDKDWIFWEQYWVWQCKAWGFNLVNHTMGGEGLTMKNKTSFKKGNKPWNTGKGNTERCITCGKQFNTSKSSVKQGIKNCSKECARRYRKLHPSNTQFKKNSKPWNKGKIGYKITGKKTSRPVLQYSMNGKFIKEHIGCREAAKVVGCIPENIRICCVGKSKTAKKFKWLYKK